MAKKLAIVHFQPLEQYPPIMNLLKYLQGDARFSVVVFTTEKETPPARRFSSHGISIRRYGKQGSGRERGYICHALFNFLSLVRLLIFRPGAIMYYETYSALPAVIYKKLFPGTELFVHYHEYTSLEEVQELSGFARFLHLQERKLYHAAAWISHTNADRLELFKNEHPETVPETLHMLPNHPPRDWYEIRPEVAKKNARELKVVYVGSLSLQTMYTRAFSAWVLAQEGRVTWHIYSGNLDKDVIEYFNELNSGCIELKGAVDYYALPGILPNYDVGVILYNGHIPNFVYNVPNKLFEYYALGLTTWCSKDMISVKSFINQYNLSSVLVVDFEKAFELDEACGSVARPGTEDKGVFCYEAEYEGLTNALIGL